MTPSENPVFCAIDTPDVTKARALAAKLAGSIGGIKLGLEFFMANGPDGVRAVVGDHDLPLFLDLKQHDIPNTVAGGIRSIMALKPAITNVHAVGGAEMMRAAADAASEESARLGIPRPKVIAVTVLTSMDDAGLNGVGVPGTAFDQVKRLALLAQASGMDGVVCSAQETTMLRAECGDDFLLVVPGIRPAWSAANDQKRITTPAQAVADGAHKLVIGRPITAAADPAQAAHRVVEELKAGV